ncbi:uncharacterized protein [Ptychodera flava]|uniref:uncharacterized protein n=1 Tax=Ptychodera flava TaxID=63121 RepID=UPI00396A7C2B
MAITAQNQMPLVGYLALAVLSIYAAKGSQAYPIEDMAPQIGDEDTMQANQQDPYIVVQQESERGFLSRKLQASINREGHVGDIAMGDAYRQSDQSSATVLYVVAALGGMVLLTTLVVTVATGSNKLSKSSGSWFCGSSCFRGLLGTENEKEEAHAGVFSEKYGKTPFVELFPVMPSDMKCLSYDLATTPPEDERFKLSSIGRIDSGIDDCFIVSDDDAEKDTDENLTQSDMRTKLRWTEMRGKFNQHGGLLESDQSDVKLILPEGALQGDQLTELYVRVFVEVAQFSCTDEKSFFITPIVECGPPGLEFMKPVQIVLPHRVKLGGPSKKIVTKIDTNLFKAVYSNQVLDTSTPRPVQVSFTPASHVTEASSDRSVTFDVDEKFVNINTTHFTLFGCVGPRRQHQLRLETFAYYNSRIDEGKKRLIVQYRVYITSPDKDRKMSIKETERSLGGRLCTPVKPFHLLGKADVNMDLYFEDAEDLTIRKTPEFVANSDFYEDSSSCFQVTITRSLEDVKEGTLSSCMMGEFRLVQRSTDKRAKKTDHAYSQVLELTGVNLPKSISKIASKDSLTTDGSDGEEIAAVADKTLSVVSSNLSPQQMRAFGRSLGLSDVTIEQVEHDYGREGVQETTYQILRKWKTELGSSATFEALVKALEDSDCCGVAEQLYTHHDE